MTLASPLPLVVHEPRTAWGRQLRARAFDWPARVVETRSLDDLRAATRAPHGVLVIDAADRPLVALDQLAEVAPGLADWLVLWIDAPDDPERAWAARELGASHVLTRPVPPPEVAALLRCWVDLLVDRRDAAGWVTDPEHDPDAWLADLVPALRRPGL